MRNWLTEEGATDRTAQDEKRTRVAVVHCKAGKGRSGSMAISYLMTHDGWSKEAAIQQFTDRRMRPGFGAGISIPSQKRWLDYVDRWANKGGRMYVERPIEVAEVHVWGLREGTKIEIEGYIEEGRKIKNFHTFEASEQDDIEQTYDPVQVNANTQAEKPGFASIVSEVVTKRMLKHAAKQARARSSSPIQSNSPLPTDQSPALPAQTPAIHATPTSTPSSASTLKPPENPVTHMESASTKSSKSVASAASNGFNGPPPPRPPTFTSTSAETRTNTIFRPSHPILLPTSDINLAVEQRRGWNTVTCVAHVWFNCYFEGNGPENWAALHSSTSTDHLTRMDTEGREATDGTNEEYRAQRITPKPDDSGVFTINFDAMDGIKGSSRKGTRAFDRVAVVWKAAATEPIPSRSAFTKERTQAPDLVVIPEPGLGTEVSGEQPADFEGDSSMPTSLDAEENLEERDSDSEDGAEGIKRGVIG